MRASCFNYVKADSKRVIGIILVRWENILMIKILWRDGACSNSEKSVVIPLTSMTLSKSPIAVCCFVATDVKRERVFRSFRKKSRL